MVRHIIGIFSQVKFGNIFSIVKLNAPSIYTLIKIEKKFKLKILDILHKLE